MRQGSGRREFLCGLGAGVFGTALSSRRGSPKTATSGWPEFGFDARNTGYAPDATGPTWGGETRWTFETETGDGKVVSCPAVAGDTVYVGSEDSVYALDRSTGERRWRFGGALGQPVVGDGTVYVGDTEGSVYALAADDGTEQWTTELPGAARPATVVGETLYAWGEGVYAVDRTGGEVAWTYGDTDSHYGAAVDEGLVYFAGRDETVTALDRTTGERRWQVTIGGWVNRPPSVADGTVYVPAHDDRVYALDGGTGDRRWTFGTGDLVQTTPAVAGDVVVFGSNDKSVYAVERSSGEKRWEFETGAAVWSSPAVAGDTVYVGGFDTRVYGIVLGSGVERWSFSAETAVEAPAVAGGVCYVGAGERLYALADPVVTSTPDGPYTLVLLAVDENGDPVGEVLLRAAWSGGERTVSTVASGRAYVDVPAGAQITITVPDAEYARADSAAEYVHTASSNGQEVSVPVTQSSATTTTASTETTTTTTPTGTDTTSTTPGRTTDGTTTRQRPDTTGRRSTDADTDESGGIDPLTVAVGVGALGLGGGGAAWWVRRGSGDGDTRPERDGQARETGAHSPAESGGSSTGDPVGGPGASGGADEPGSRRDDDRIPQTIPRAPDVSVSYDALQNEEPIGSGGEADVVRATVPTPDGPVTVAVKRPRIGGMLDQNGVERLLNEAETWSKLDDHDHVVGVVDYGHEPQPWIAMEYMDGGHLGRRAGSMDLRAALWTAIAISRGVRHAHRRGVAHLDLKPENVLFRTVEGAWDVPKVGDWGLSKHLLEHSKSVEGLSPRYAAPEQFDEAYGPADDLTDIYQLGTVFYELFTGQPPFEGGSARVMRAILEDRPTPPSELASVPQALDDVILTALAKDPADRYDNVAYLRDALLDLFERS